MAGWLHLRCNPPGISLNLRNLREEVLRKTKSWLVAVSIALLGGSITAWSQTGPRVLDGRMMGGGSVITDENDLWAPAGTRITHGFELNCDPVAKTNSLDVQVHLPNGDWGRFNLEQMTYAWCSSSDTSTGRRPAAGFDTFEGAGTGRFNGESGFCADWAFTDQGEPGTMDRILRMRIWRPLEGSCNNSSGLFIFSIYQDPGHTLTFGNHVALRK